MNERQFELFMESLGWQERDNAKVIELLQQINDNLKVIKIISSNISLDMKKEGKI